jgi:hypothetical protein
MFAVLLIVMIPALAFAAGVKEKAPITGDAHRMVSLSDVVRWDYEVDMIVVGYGLAGATAVLEATNIKPDASILIFEKMPVELQGGQTKASGQSLLQVHPDGLADFRKYYTRCFDSNPLPKDYFEWFTSQFTLQLDWIKSVIEPVGYEIGYQGGGPLVWGKKVTEFPEFPGSNFLACTTAIREKGYPGFQYGGDWDGFSAAVEARMKKLPNIKLLWETPVVSLIQDTKTRTVWGVVAKDADGKLITAKARKGVVVACGGYESNMEMNKHFNGSQEVYNTGNEGNTGDGVEMMMAVGAKMWHFDNQTRSGGEVPGIKVPDFPTSFIREILPQRWDWIELSKGNERFYDESRRYSTQHWKYYDKGTGNYIDLKHFRSLPVHMIFDDDMRKAGPIVSTWFAAPITTYNYKWSKDNSVEINKGWIIKADSIEELAKKINRDPKEMKAAVDAYNEMCKNGVDTEWGREKAKLMPIDTPPFYAVSETPCLPATSGGAMRNTKSQVLDWNENAIPQLYEAGELGSFVPNLYQNGTFLMEAIFSARAAVQDIFRK